MSLLLSHVYRNCKGVTFIRLNWYLFVSEYISLVTEGYLLYSFVYPIFSNKIMEKEINYVISV